MNLGSSYASYPSYGQAYGGCLPGYPASTSAYAAGSYMGQDSLSAYSGLVGTTAAADTLAGLKTDAR